MTKWSHFQIFNLFHLRWIQDKKTIKFQEYITPIPIHCPHTYKIKAIFKTVCHCPAGLFNDNVQNILYTEDNNKNNSNSHNNNGIIVHYKHYRHWYEKQTKQRRKCYFTTLLRKECFSCFIRMSAKRVYSLLWLLLALRIKFPYWVVRVTMPL